jgi:extracellular elastinolytic metalloproteinase
MLFEVFWNLADNHGLSPNLMNSKQPHGNVVTIQLLMDGLALQSCQPDFIIARDAFLLADEIRYNGQHKCNIWRAFSKRGLGSNAKSSEPWVDDYTVPRACGAPKG